MQEYKPVAFDAEDEDSQAETCIVVTYTDAALWEIEQIQRHCEAAKKASERRVPGKRIPKGSPRFLHFIPAGYSKVSMQSNVVHDVTCHSNDKGETSSVVLHYVVHSLRYSLTICKTKEWAELMKEANIERHPCMIELLALEGQEIDAINAAAPRRFE